MLEDSAHSGWHHSLGRDLELYTQGESKWSFGKYTTFISHAPDCGCGILTFEVLASASPQG